MRSHCTLTTLVRTYMRYLGTRNISSAVESNAAEQKHVNATHQQPKVFTLDGSSVPTDVHWNLSSHITGLLERRLLEEPDNPLSLLKRRIVEHMQSRYRTSGQRSPTFTVCDRESRVVSVHDNFDSLLTPSDHVSRRPTDTYYINEHHCLRAHTSAHQHRLIKQGLNSFLVVGDVYRRDEINKTHYPCFHQMEGVQLFNAHQLFGSDQDDEMNMFEKGERTSEKQETHTIDTANVISFRLKGVLEELTKHVFGEDIAMRWVDAYFPFTHPSFELEIYYDGEWMEVLGCGVIEQKLLQMAGADGKVGWAFGLGLERLAMVLYGIPDIRLFWSRDSGFISQFADHSPSDNIKYKAVSVHPQLYFDLSFWLPEQAVPEAMTANTYDLIRSVGGELVEQVSLTDSFVNKKTNRVSQTYRLVYRSSERALSKQEVNVIHKQIETLLRERYGVQLR